MCHNAFITAVFKPKNPFLPDTLAVRILGSSFTFSFFKLRLLYLHIYVQACQPHYRRLRTDVLSAADWWRMLRDSSLPNCLHWQNHQIAKHGFDFGKRFACPECKEVFKTYTQMKGHITRLHDTMDSTCDVCNKVLKGDTGLLCHLRNVHFCTNAQVCGNRFSFLD